MSSRALCEMYGFEASRRRGVGGSVPKSSSSGPIISSKSIDSRLRVTFLVRGGRPFCILGKFSFAPPRLGEKAALRGIGGTRIWLLERFFDSGAEIVTERVRAGTGVEGVDIGDVERLASRARGTMTFWTGGLGRGEG